MEASPRQLARQEQDMTLLRIYCARRRMGYSRRIALSFALAALRRINPKGSP